MCILLHLTNKQRTKRGVSRQINNPKCNTYRFQLLKLAFLWLPLVTLVAMRVDQPLHGLSVCLFHLGNLPAFINQISISSTAKLAYSSTAIIDTIDWISRTASGLQTSHSSIPKAWDLWKTLPPSAGQVFLRSHALELLLWDIYRPDAVPDIQSSESKH